MKASNKTFRALTLALAVVGLLSVSLSTSAYANVNKPVNPFPSGGPSK
jgi:hypothetical protein